MKNRKIMLLLFVMMLCIPFGVKAATLKKFPMSVNGHWVAKCWVEDDGTHYGNYTQFIDIDSKTAYCIDWGIDLGLSAGHAYGFESDFTDPSQGIQPAATTSFSTTLEDYLRNHTNVEASSINQLIQKINLIYYYGFHTTITADTNSAFPYESRVKFLATQALIWEAMHESGSNRNLTAREMEELYSEAEIQQKISRGAGTYTIESVSDINFVEKGSHDDVVPKSAVTAEKNSITNKVNKYNKKPSFCNQTFEYEIGENPILTDENNVLDNYYNYSCSNGIACEAIGNNKLKLNLPTATQNGTITLTSKSLSLGGISDVAYVYAKSDGNQGVVVPGKPTANQCTVTIKVNAPAPVPGCIICGDGDSEDDFHYDTNDHLSQYAANCVFHEDITEANCKPEEKPKCWVCENSSGEREYIFDIAPPASLGELTCNPYPEITEENCKPNPGCYICDSGYVWSEDGEPTGETNCILEEDITEEKNCVIPVVPQTSEPVPSNPKTAGLRIAYVSLICGIAAALGFVYFYSKKPENE